MKIYILYGTWGNNETDGANVLMVSDKPEPVRKRLEEIADSKACEFLKLAGKEPDEDKGFWYYEASDQNCGYARFYITEKDLKFSAGTIRQMVIEAEKTDRLADIREYIRDLGFPAWKCWYAIHNQETLDRILAQMEKHESCNVAYNDTLHFAVKTILDGIQLNDDILGKLWEMFGETAINDNDETLDIFMDFPAGTDRIEIWHWFDEYFTNGLGAFMKKDNG